MRMKFRKFPKTHSLKKVLFTACFGLFLLCAFWILDVAQEVRMPEAGAPAELYATQTQHDLRQVFTQAIREAKQSVLLIIYTLTDDHIIKALNRKSEEGLDVWVIYDGNTSPKAAYKLGSKVRVLKRFGNGLMHQKILVIDGEKTWIGSANMTGESLKFHANLVMSVYSHQIASFVIEKARSMPATGDGIRMKHREFNVGGQNIDFWFFPDDPPIRREAQVSQ